MLATIRGEPTDRIPWAPRMDLWYIAQRARGTVPEAFQGLDIAGMADRFGVACRALRGDHTLPIEPDDLALRGLGLENHPHYPYRVELRGLPMEFRHEGDSYVTRIRTPAGEIVTHMVHTPDMLRDGISLPFVKQFAIRSAQDFEAIAQVFEHLEVIPTPGNYAAFRRRIGERGLAIASGCVGASPLHHIFHELVPQEQFFYLFADEPEALRALAKRIEPFYEKVLDAVLQCEAEVVFWSGNYDQDLTWPAFFQAEITPWLQRVGDRLHAAGKFLLTHTDGENQKLLPLYPSCGFDIAESVCPKPMTRCTLKEVRDGMGPNVTVWGGIPSVALLDDSMPGAAFEAYLDTVFAELGTGERLIFGVSDMVPPDANLSRLERIKERIAAFGPVRPARAPRSIGG
jgi:hypothetical protein